MRPWGLVTALTSCAALILAALILLAGAGGAQARTCSPGYVHAIIEGEQKCLHAGEYCEPSEQRTYRRYHFTCTRVNGAYRLERSADKGRDQRTG